MTSLIILKSLLLAKSLKKRKNNKLKDKSCSEARTSRNICRTCCSKNGKINIFDNEQYPNMPEDIAHFSGLDVNKQDGFPEYICSWCLKLLNGCIQFRLICKLSNKRLSKLQDKEDTIELMNDVSIVSNEVENRNSPSPTFSDEIINMWSCTNCSQAFVDEYEYTKHMEECVAGAKEKSPRIKQPFLCDICGKTTRSNANLLVHKAIHTNVFPFQCDQCPYKGRTMDLLKVHKRSHLIDKPYKCTQCPKAASTSSNLDRHIRHAHSTTKPYKCTYCDKSFSYQHDMKRHVKEIHLRQGVVDCDICFKKFNTKKILQGHRVKVHKIKADRHGRLPSYLHCVEET